MFQGRVGASTGPAVLPALSLRASTPVHFHGFGAVTSGCPASVTSRPLMLVMPAGTSGEPWERPVSPRHGRAFILHKCARGEQVPRSSLRGRGGSLRRSVPGVSGRLSSGVHL